MAAYKLRTFLSRIKVPSGGFRNFKVPSDLPISFIKPLKITTSGNSNKSENQIYIPKMTWGVVCMAQLTDQTENQEDSEVENDQNVDSEEQEVENYVESVNEDSDVDANDSFLVENEDLEHHKVELIAGDKEGSDWLVLDDIYILHKYRTSGDEIFWECSGRRAFDCPFKAATTQKDDDEENPEPELVFMYKLDTHDCGQTKLGPIMQKFRNQLKRKVSENFKNKFHNVFAEEKKMLLNEYKNSPDLLERIVYELKDKRSYRVAAQRARAKKFPKNPTCASDMNLDLIGLKRFQLGSSSHFDPEVKGKEIILLGTPLTAKAWAQSEFKSGDGTFKICPKQFYQV